MRKQFKEAIKFVSRNLDGIQLCVSEIAGLLRFKGSVVFCEECGIAMKKDKAYKVEDIDPRVLWLNLSHNIYYCKEHKRPYDISHNGKFWKKQEAKNIKVNIKGKPIK